MAPVAPTTTFRTVDDNASRLSTSMHSDLNASRRDYATMNDSPQARLSLPQSPERRKAFMDKLFTVSRMHVDEAGGADGLLRRAGNHPQPSITYSLNTNSIDSTVNETDLSFASASTIQQRQLGDEQGSPVDNSSSTPKKAEAKDVQQFLIGLVDTTVGACLSLPGRCEDVKADLAERRTNMRALPSASHINLSVCSTDDDDENFDDSLCSTFDDTVADQDTCGEPSPESAAVKVEQSDDSTTLSSRNSGWL